MPLKLSIIRHPEDEPETAPGAVAVRVFDRSGGVLGRDPDVDWVLPHKYVSRHHAEIRVDEGRYYVRDTSQNGVYVNGQLVGQGSSALLTDGDRITIGDYEILVQTELASAPSVDSQSLPDTSYSPERGLGLEPLLPQPPAAPAGGHGTFRAPPFDDPFASPAWLGPSAPPPAPPPPTEGDVLPVINEPYRAPAAVSEIPENWWEEGDGAPGPTPPAGRPHTAPTPDRSGAGAPPPIPAPFVAPRTPAATGLSAAPPEGQVRGARGLEAFFGAAGIAPTVPASMSEEELFALAGAMIREFVSGTMELLRARASIKQEARLEMTALRPTENNPLKFAVTAEEALERLLTPQAMKGYLEPRRAVHEAMQDLRAHELAVLAGMEAAVRGMFERFDPERLERDFSEQSLLASILPAHRKAKCWDLFTQRFRQIGEEAREDFNALFGRAFARAYQEQVERLRSAGPR